MYGPVENIVCKPWQVVCTSVALTLSIHIYRDSFYRRQVKIARRDFPCESNGKGNLAFNPASIFKLAIRAALTLINSETDLSCQESQGPLPLLHA